MVKLPEKLDPLLIQESEIRLYQILYLYFGVQVIEFFALVPECRFIVANRNQKWLSTVPDEMDLIFFPSRFLQEPGYILVQVMAVVQGNPSLVS
jgi:hypothetical protein